LNDAAGTVFTILPRRRHRLFEIKKHNIQIILKPMEVAGTISRLIPLTDISINKIENEDKKIGV